METIDTKYSLNSTFDSSNTSTRSSLSSSSEIHDNSSTSTSTSNENIAFLIKSIDGLQDDLKLQTTESNHWKNVAKNLEKELKTLKASIKNYLEPDQIAMMSGKKVKWTNKTIKKGLILRYKLGDKFFNNTFRRNYSPFPEKSTLLPRIKPFKINPGILKLNIRVLGEKMKKIPRN